jgi:glycosyltransferase involved in cell wall biosynthesis
VPIPSPSRSSSSTAATPGPADQPERADRWSIVGPTHPFRGGIPRHTTFFADAVAAAGIDVTLRTFTRQYPTWLYKGASDRDPQQARPTGLTPSHEIDGIGPHTWWRTGRSIAAERPDVMIGVWWHPFFAPMMGTVLRLVRRRSPDTLRVALCHNVLPHESSPVDRVLVRRALAPVDALVVHAAEQAAVATELLGPRPVLVTPHPTYTVEAAPTEDADAAADAGGTARASGAEEPVHLLFFGIVRQYKGVDVLLRAVAQLRRERPVRVVVAGEFWDPVDPYERLVDELGLHDVVDLRPGYVPDDELGRHLARADVMVAPYRSATQSGAVEMAFGAGLPVVASRVGGLAEQIDDGVDGLLVDPDDVGALLSALRRAADAGTRRDLTAGARRRAGERTWAGLVDDVRRFTDELAAARR